MPYFITDSAPDCSGWATIKEDGEVIGCHATKQDAIDQMVAVSIAEGMEPGGERAEPGDLSVGDFVSWGASGGTGCLLRRAETSPHAQLRGTRGE